MSMRVLMTTLCALTCAFVAGVSAAPAALDEFGEEGSGAAQFSSASGVAVDQTSGSIYLVDRNNQRIDKFDATGAFLTSWGWGVADGTTQALQTCTTTCFAGIKGSGAGQLDEPEGVAVDNSPNPLDTSAGDVYVVDVQNLRVEKFSPEGEFLLMFGGGVDETTGGNVCTAASGDTCGPGTEGTGHGQFGAIDAEEGGDFIAVDGAGTIYVGDINRVQEFSPNGKYKSQLNIPGAGKVLALAVDSHGDIYVRSKTISGVQEYNSSGTLVDTLDSAGAPKALALDPADDLFIDDGEDFDHHLLEYDSPGDEIDSFDSGTEGGSAGIAFGDSVEEMYVLNREAVRFVTPPPPGPLVEANSESAASVVPTMATLDATIDPEGRETTYHFEYGLTASYEASTPENASLRAGFEDQGASAGLTELLPRTTYHFRVVATNSAGTIDGADETFTTLPPAGIESESASEVTSRSATIAAQIDSLGSDTTYRFEYDTSAYDSSARHGTSVPVPEGAIGSGTSAVTVSQNVQELAPSTVYHYRVVASNALGTVDGPDRVFTTQAREVSPQLPDGRAWELVSPPDKDGANIEAFATGGAVSQASEDGNAITYAASGPTEATPPGTVSPERVQVLSTRGSDGWKSQDIATPHNAPTAGLQLGHETEFKLFSSDLSVGIVEPAGETPLSPEASEKTIYLRDDADGNYQPLVTPASAPGAMFANHVEFVGATPDLTHVVLGSTVSLTPGSEAGLYEWSEGRLQPVSVLPHGEPALSPGLGRGGFSLGGIVRHAISNDGDRIVWQAEGHLYMRDMDREETVQLDTVEHGARGGTGVPAFQTASSDESKVFFTDEQQLTVDSTARSAAPDLYEFEATANGTGRLTDLTVDHNAGEHADMQGVVLGASEDGSSLYIVAKGILTDIDNGFDEGAASGQDNLYAMHYNGVEWTTAFVAKLSDEDDNDWEAGEGHNEFLTDLTSRVSPDGNWLAFMSDRSLTGYDNDDTNSGEPDEEVFLYEAGSGDLACASCNPSGSRPTGVFDSGEFPRPLVDIPAVWEKRWLAGVIPGWTPVALDHALYQSRYLSDSGRLFFDSADALVPDDSNGKEDVYEYEPQGIGSCSAASESFSDKTNGCVALISSGRSGEESAFLDASENGDDVFFLTAARLTSENVEGLSVYDAHVCSAAAPCSPAAVTPPPPCLTAESCRAEPPPESLVFGAPVSATFTGVGNLPPIAAQPKQTPKHLACKRGFVRRRIKAKLRCVKQKRSVRDARREKRSTPRRRR
jgi:WD40-like Beta Propeller Repeat